MHSGLASMLLLSVLSAALCYRSPVSGGGSYTLPKIGNFPAPQPTFPRNHGLPDAYKNTRHFRSVDNQLESLNDHNLEEPTFEGTFDEVFRQRRSPDELVEQPSFADENAELTRLRRSSGFRVIQPTYRPPPPTRPRTYYV